MRGRVTIAAFTVAAVLGLAQVGTAGADVTSTLSETTSTLTGTVSTLTKSSTLPATESCLVNALGVKLVCGPNLFETGKEEVIVINKENCLLKVESLIKISCGSSTVELLPPSEGQKVVVFPTGPAGAEGKAGATGSVGAPAPAAKGEVLAAKASSGSGVARLARWGVRLRVRRDNVVIPIRCYGRAGLLCRSRLQIVASRWSAKRAFRLRTGPRIHWVGIRLPRGLARSVYRTRYGIRAYIDISSGRIAKAAALHRGIVRLIR